LDCSHNTKIIHTAIFIYDETSRRVGACPVLAPEAFGHAETKGAQQAPRSVFRIYLQTSQYHSQHCTSGKVQIKIDAGLPACLQLHFCTIMTPKQSGLIVAAVCTTLLLVNLCAEPSGHTSGQAHSAALRQAIPQDNPVLAALRAAAAGDSNSSSLAQLRQDAVHNTSCCRIGSMQGVLNAAAAVHKAARSLDAASTMQSARSFVFASRSHLAKPWEDTLQPVVTANTLGSNSSCLCRSLEVLPASDNSSTAILLVTKSWAGLMQHWVALYQANLLMLWFYARLHGYGLHIYVHGADLPPWMPVHFIKAAGLLHMMDDLHYQNVMYADWDVLLSPHTAPPLSVFYGEYPKASLLVQGEYNFAAGANLWRNTPDARTFLHAWWELGAKGCCPTAQHDQSAFKHIIAAYLANFTGEDSFYGPEAQRLFSLPKKLPPPPPTEPGVGPFAVQTSEPQGIPVDRWLRWRPFLRERGSAVGIVGLDIHYPR
jgi:hypothetical protein